MPPTNVKTIPTSQCQFTTIPNPNYFSPRIQVSHCIKKGGQYIRQVVDSLLYYAHMVDLMILFALSHIAEEQTNPINKTTKHTQQQLDYLYYNPTANN